jgi:hypothetical protein
MYKRQRVEQAGGHTIEAEVDLYRSTPVPDGANALDWWRDNASRFPRIARQARMLLAIPCSSAPAERVFSKLNIVVERRKARMLPQRAANRVFVKSNIDMIDPIPQPHSAAPPAPAPG